MAENASLLPETLDPELIHRVLLTDPSQFASLRVSPNVSSDDTPTFEQFRESLQVQNTSEQHSVDQVIKSAYRDQLVDRMKNDKSLHPAQEL